MRKAREFISACLMWAIAGLLWVFEAMAPQEFKESLSNG